MDDAVAIVGTAGRFPGASDVDTLWRNLLDEVHAVRRFTDDELRAAGVSEDLLSDPRYVRAHGWLDGLEDFDAAFFACSDDEAAELDPQHRLFLEVAWHAMQDAGYVPTDVDATVGVFAGTSVNRYFLRHLYTPAAAGGRRPHTVRCGLRRGTRPRYADRRRPGGPGARLGVPRRGSPCLLGSVKTSIGNLDAAAGIASLIKAALAVRHRIIPASLHYTSPLPDLDLAGGPFEIAAKTAPWPPGAPPIAGVTSLGLGGPAVHVLAGPADTPPPAAPTWHTLPLTPFARRRHWREPAGYRDD